MRRHSLFVLSLFLGLFLLGGCHGGDEVANAPDDPIPTDLPFSGTAAFGAVADPLKGLTIAFGTPMDTVSVEDNLVLTNASASVSAELTAAVNISGDSLTFHWNAGKDTVTIFGPLPYCEDYVLAIGANTANAAGVARGEDQVFEFSTRENPGDLDGVDCKADLAFDLQGAGFVLLGDEVGTMLGSTKAVPVIDLAMDGKHWLYENLQGRSFQRLDNVTAEGHAMLTGQTGTSPSLELLFWSRFEQTPNADPTGSISYNEDDNRLQVRPSIPDLNADGLSEIVIGDDYMFQFGADTLGVLRDHIIFGGSPIRMDSEVALLEDAQVRHTAYAKGPRAQVGDFDGDGAKDLLYIFIGDLGGGHGSRWFIVFSPVLSREMFYVIPDGPEANWLFNEDQETIIDAPKQPYLQSGVVGDFNGDGIDDIAAHAIGTDPVTGNKTGDLYLLFGVSGMRGDRTLATAPVSKVVASLIDPYALNFYAKDLNADGYADLIIKNKDKGDVTVILGQEIWAPSYALAELAPVVFSGGTDYTSLGDLLLLGDINNDGYEDLGMGAKGSFGGEYGLLFMGRKYLPGAKVTGDQADVALEFGSP